MVTHDCDAITTLAKNWDEKARGGKNIAKRFGVSIRVDTGSQCFVKALAMLAPSARAFIVERVFEKLDKEMIQESEYIFDIFLEKRRKTMTNYRQKLKRKIIRKKAKAHKQPEKALKRCRKPKMPDRETEAA